MKENIVFPDSQVLHNTEQMMHMISGMNQAGKAL
jgi:hypothetical protein